LEVKEIKEVLEKEFGKLPDINKSEEI